MAAHQASPSLGFSRQEHWSGLPFPSPMHASEKWKSSRSVVSNSSRPQGLQPTRLLRPWDFPGKSTGVGCHCLVLKRGSAFNFLHIGIRSVAQSCPTLCDHIGIVFFKISTMVDYKMSQISWPELRDLHFILTVDSLAIFTVLFFFTLRSTQTVLSLVV